MKANRLSIFALSALIVLSFSSCRKDEPKATEEPKVPEDVVLKTGFYVLNQGAMGTNKASLDCFDYVSGTYKNNVFDPSVTLGLGDTGNDAKVYGGKLYITVNGSNLVEVADASTAKHLASITINSCRYVNFYNGKVYVTSYNGFNNGYVSEIDTTSLTVTRKCTVSVCPEEMAFAGTKMYVAHVGDYDHGYSKKLSVIDMSTFTETKQIDVALNMSKVRPTADGKLLINSLGNYYDVSGSLVVFDPMSETVVKSFDIPVYGLDIYNGKCYCFTQEYDESWNTTYRFYTIDLATYALGGSPITDGTEKEMQNPSNIAIDSRNGNFYVCDAADYVTPGTVTCYSSAGKKQWTKTAGDIPYAIAFK